MQNDWVFSATEGVYTSRTWTASSSSGNEFFSNQINFEFFDDIECNIPSIGQTGSIIINGRSNPNAVFQALPTNIIDVSNPISLSWAGVTNQLQVIIKPSLNNTNYIKISFYRG